MTRRLPGRAAHRARVTTAVLGVVIVAQLGIISAYGALTELRFPVWSPIDEAAHVSYVQHVAETHHLPVMGRSYVSPAVFAVTVRQQPKAAVLGIRHSGLAGLSYEAFQPPLYYIVAAPVYDVAGGSLLNRVRALRLLGLGLLVATAAMTARLARAAAGRRWLGAWSLALVFLTLPGVVVRSVTVSNMALEMLLAVALASEAILAWRRHSVPRYLLAAVLLGLGLLTQTLFVAMVPGFGLVVAAEVWRRRWWRGAGLALASVALPLALVSPWVAFNESHFHSVTADSVATAVQDHYVNPTGQTYLTADLGSELVSSVLVPALPGEWGAWGASQSGLQAATDATVAALLALGALVLLRPSGLLSAEAALLALPLITLVATLCVVTVGEQWYVMLARYTYPALPLWGVLAGTVALRRRPGPTELAVPAVAALGTAAVASTWILAAGVFL